MSSQNNEKLLELYTKAISIEALQNAEKYLENSLPLGKGVAKERLIEKALYEEQQIEHNRKLAESLRTEFKDLEHKIVCDANKLRTVEELRQERDELIKRRAAEDAVLPERYRTLEEMEKTMAETAELKKKVAILMKEVEEKAVNYTC